MNDPDPVGFEQQQQMPQQMQFNEEMQPGRGFQESKGMAYQLRVAADGELATAVAQAAIATYQDIKSKAWLAAGLVVFFIFFVIGAWGWEFGIWMFLLNAQSIGYLNIAGGNSFVNSFILLSSLFTVVGGFVLAVATGGIGASQISALTMDVMYFPRYTSKVGFDVGMGISNASSADDLRASRMGGIASLVFMWAGAVCMLLDSIFHGTQYAATGQGYTPVEQDYALWVCIVSAIGAGAGFACASAGTVLFVYASAMVEFVKMTRNNKYAFLREQMLEFRTKPVTIFNIWAVKDSEPRYMSSATAPVLVPGAVTMPPSTGTRDVVFSNARVGTNAVHRTAAAQRPQVGTNNIQTKRH